MAAHQLNGDRKMAEYWVNNVRSRRRDVSSEHFFTAFPFHDVEARQKIQQALARSEL